MTFGEREGRHKKGKKNGDENTPDDLSKRRFLKALGIGTAAVVGITTDLAIATPLLKRVLTWSEQAAPQIKDAIELPTLVPEVDCIATRHVTTYSLEALRRTVGVVFGDSIGKGYYKKGEVSQPAITFAIEAINENAYFQRHFNIESTWSQEIFAVEGSRIVDVQKQFKEPRFKKIIDQEQNVDLWLSVGGNDLVHALANKAKPLGDLGKDPFKPEFFNLDDDMVNAIHTYKQGFKQLLKDVSAKAKKEKIHRLIVEGLPNLGNAKSIEYVSRDGNVQATYNLSDGLFTRHFARNLSVMVNNAMKEGINELLDSNPKFDVLFLNNFDELSQQDLLGEHPLPKGQQQMAQHLFYRAFYDNQNLGKIIFPQNGRRMISQPNQPVMWGDKSKIRFVWS